MNLKAFIKTRLPILYRILIWVRRPTGSIPFSLWVVNILFQRIFGINRRTPWMVNYTSYIVMPERLRIGKNVWKSFALSGGCYLQAINGIVIGDDTIFAPGIKIISANHDLSDFNIHPTEKPVTIGKNCWIGSGAIILPGVELGDHCIVGAGAVVTHCFPENSVLAGVPAKSILNEKPIPDYPS
jgi:acetyltransferase-like isoleucine patch superfamily enzyme